MKMLIYTVVGLISCISVNSFAYNKCTDSKGKVSYQDKPCRQGDIGEAKGIKKDLKISEWMGQYPKKSMIISERGSKPTYWAAFESITVKNQDYVMSVDYKNIPLRIWEYERFGEQGKIIEATCIKSYRKVNEETIAYFTDELAMVADKKVVDSIKSIVKSSKVYVLECNAKFDFVTRPTVTANVPGDDICPTAFTKEFGTIPVAHFAMFSSNSLTVVSIPQEDAC